MTDALLRDRIGAVLDRWYQRGFIRYTSRDDEADDTLLRDELVKEAEAALDARIKQRYGHLPDSLLTARHDLIAARGLFENEKALRAQDRERVEKVRDKPLPDLRKYPPAYENGWLDGRAFVLAAIDGALQ